MTAFSVLDKAKSRIVSGHPFFSTILLGTPIVEKPKDWWDSNRLPRTAATDGKKIYYCAEFFQSLLVGQVMTVLAHEVLHIALLHPWRRGTRESRKWNIAADYAVNPVLVDNGFDKVGGMLLDPQFANMSAEEIFKLLPDIPKGDMFDSVLDSSVDGVGAELAEAQAKALVEKAVRVAKAMGKLPQKMEQLVGKALKPPVLWPDVLRNFFTAKLKTDLTWRRPSRRGQVLDMYLPSLHSDALGSVVIFIDVSGSTSSVLNMFEAHMREIFDICRPRSTTIVYVDAAVQHVDTLDDTEVLKFRPVGGGGTDFRPAFKYVLKNMEPPDVAVFLTDLEGSFPDAAPDYPLIWAATTDHKVPFGDVVRIKT